MATTPSDSYRASAAPHDSRSTLRALDISDAGDASIALATGVYELSLIGSVGAFIVAGATTASLAAISSGDPEELGFRIAPGAVVTYLHDATVGDGELHAITDDTGSATVICVRKAAL